MLTGRQCGRAHRSFLGRLRTARPSRLYRQVRALGHDCMVVAPALIPKRAGEPIKTHRRDAVTLARLHRAGELTGVRAPDPAQGD